MVVKVAAEQLGRQGGPVVPNGLPTCVWHGGVSVLTRG